MSTDVPAAAAVSAAAATPPAAAVSPAAAAPARSRLAALTGWTRGSAIPFVWIGVVVAAGGFVLIAVAWGQIAATLNVGLQMPWLVSAGFTGLGVILVGLTIVIAAVHHQVAIERHRQLEAI